MRSNFGTIMQLGYIVHDVQAAAEEWVRRTGAGPFYLLERVDFDRYYYRGVHTPLAIRVAFGYWGSVQVELITPLNDADTLYRRALQSGAGQLNHCATVVSDIDALLARHDLQARVVHAGTMPTGLKFVYLEEYLPGGQHLELIEAQPSTLQAFAGMEKISRSWDGKDAIRPMARVRDDLAAER